MPKAQPYLNYWGQTVPAMYYTNYPEVYDSMQAIKNRMGNPTLVLSEGKDWFGAAAGLTPSNPADTSRALRNSWCVVFIQKIYDFCYINPDEYTQDTTVWNQLSGQIIIHELGHEDASLTHQNDPRFKTWHVDTSKFWCVMHQGNKTENGIYVEKSNFCESCRDSIEKEPNK